MSSQKSDYEVVIVGAGPAGFTAGVYLGRFLIKTLILESPADELSSPVFKNRARSTTQGKYYNLPGFPSGIERSTFKNQGVEHAQASGCEYREAKVGAIHPQTSGNNFLIETGEGTLTADKLILGMGIQDIWPELPNIHLFAGQSVFTSVQANGMEAQKEPASIIGNGEKAFEEALRLCTYCPKVFLLSNGEVFKASERMQQLNLMFPIEIVEEPISNLTGQDGQLQAIQFETGKSIAVSTLFTPFPHRHESDLLTHRLGLNKDEKGFVIVNSSYETSIKNIYAVGDMINNPHKQVISSMYQGMEAAWSINESIFQNTLHEAVLAVEY